MKKFDTKITISYSWEREDGGEIPDSHKEELGEDAMDEIRFNMSIDETSGELKAGVWDIEAEKEFSYKGTWRVEKT